MVSAARAVAAVFGAWWTLGSAFPLTNLTVGKDLFEKMKKPSTGGVDASIEAEIHNALLTHLRHYFAKAGNAITVEKDDVLIRKSYPDKCVDSSCGHTITILHPAAVGRLLDQSSLDFKTDDGWPGVAVFADANIDATLNVFGAVNVKSGVKLFHHCRHLARKTVNLDILSDGTAAIGLNFTARNIQVTYVDGHCSVAFDFHATVVGTIRHWNIDQVVANNCKLKILGFTIVSVCGLIEKKVRAEAQDYVNKVREVTAPKLLRRLEQKINTAVGSRVVLNVTLGDMMSNLFT